ncbi:MAG: hypothetical protein ACTHKS_12490 [Gaiellaceae bacterium]
MQSNVDFRLLERFRAKRKLNVRHSPEQKRAATAAASPRLPAIDLRD